MQGGADSAASRGPTAGPGRAFVGRQQELTQLLGAVEAAREGRAQLVLLTGEPGIGKTRLAEEFCTAARRDGITSLWGRCWEGGGAPAFWPWTQVVRAHARIWGREATVQRMGAGRAHIARIVPELDDAGRDGHPTVLAPPISPDAARFALFDAVATFVLDLAESERLVVLVLDDLHAADPASLLLLQFIVRTARDGRVVIVGAYRNLESRRRPEIDTLLTDIASGAQRYCLEGLSLPDVRRLMEQALGLPVPERTVISVRDKTEGNPYFVDELVRSLALRGDVAATAAPAGSLWITDGIRGTIRRRLENLSAECIETLTIASVVGKEFDLAVIDAVSDLAGDSLLTVVDEAAADHVIVPLPGSPIRFGFAHMLVRDVLYDDIPAGRRIALHRQIGTALETLHAADAGPHVAALAHHFLASAVTGDAERAVAYAERAGRRAMTLLGYEEAVAYYQRALDTLPSDAGTARRFELLLGLGEALDSTDASERATATFVEAARIARDLADPERLARAALGVGSLWARKLTAVLTDRSLPSLLREALDVLPAHDSDLRAALLSRLAANLCFSGARDRARTLSLQAVEMARRLGDLGLLARTLIAQHAILLGPDGLSERMKTAREIRALGEATNSREFMLRGASLTIYDSIEAGDIGAADAALRAHARLAVETGDPFELWSNRAWQAHRALLDGRFADAESHARKALDIARRRPGQQADEELAETCFTLQMFFLRKWHGRLPEIEGTFRRFEERYSFGRPGVAYLCAEAGFPEAAREQFELSLANGLASFPRDAAWLSTMNALAATCLLLGDEGRAAALYEVLLPYGDRNPTQGHAASTGAVSRTLGRLAFLTGRWSAAARHFEDALSANERMGALPWLAETQYDYATMLLAHDGAGDAVRADDLLARALATATHLGMATLQQRIEQARPRGNIPVRREPRGTDAASAPRTATLRREGEYWTIAWGGALCRLKDIRGFTYLAYLLRHPHREFHVLDLVSVGSPRNGGAPAIGGPEPDEPHGRRVGPESMERRVDARAWAEYRERLTALRAEADAARSTGDLEREDRAEREISALAQEIRRGRRPSARAGVLGAMAERARLNVTRTIRIAVTRIADNVPELGSHLAQSIRTGVFCSYRPDPLNPLHWTF